MPQATPAQEAFIMLSLHLGYVHGPGGHVLARAAMLTAAAAGVTRVGWRREMAGWAETDGRK